MAGQWQREFFLITEDPLAADPHIFDLWLDGCSVKQAAEIRRPRHLAAAAVSAATAAAGSPPLGGGIYTGEGAVVSFKIEADPSPTSSSGFASPKTRGGLSSVSAPSAGASLPATPHGGASLDIGLSAQLKEQLENLLFQDCAQQYEAFESLEESLADPEHFLEFCPVQLAPSSRRRFLIRYYSLDGRVVREVLRRARSGNVQYWRLQGRSDRRTTAELEQISKLSESKVLKVQRTCLNLQRALRWIEHAAALQGAASDDAFSGMSFSSLTASGLSPVPELAALGHQLLGRYRSIVFVLLFRFDLSAKAAQSLRSEQIEDIASVLLAAGGAPEECCGDAASYRTRAIDVLAGLRPTGCDALLVARKSSAGGRSGRTSSKSSSGEANGGPGANAAEAAAAVSASAGGKGGAPAASMAGGTDGAGSVGLGALLRARGVMSKSIQEALKQLNIQVLKPKQGEFRALLLQEVQLSDSQTPIRHDDSGRTLGSAGASYLPRGGFFSRAPARAKGGLKTANFEPMVRALYVGVASLQTTHDFVNGFFPALADFVDRLRQLDSAEPLDIFQRCYTALEAVSLKDTAPARKSLWPQWMDAWRTFLEFYRACAACVLYSLPVSADRRDRDDDAAGNDDEEEDEGHPSRASSAAYAGSIGPNSSCRASGAARTSGTGTPGATPAALERGEGGGGGGGVSFLLPPAVVPASSTSSGGGGGGGGGGASGTRSGGLTAGSPGSSKLKL